MRNRARVAAFGLLAAMPAFVAYADFILNQFYRYGTVLLDAGLLANLAWHQGVRLTGSALLDGQSFYTVHIAPIFLILSGLSWLIPVTMAQWFALITGVAHALLAVAVYWALGSAGAGLRGARVTACFAVAFSFNGLAIANVRYPHFEILLAAMMMMFLAALWRGRIIATVISFVLCLLCREDAGFHLSAFLAVLIWLRWHDGTPLRLQRPGLIFLAIGFAYSLGALLLGMALSPHQSSFARVYLGTPPFAHLDGLLVLTRAFGYAVERTYIFLPAAIAVIWAIAVRNPYLVVGYIAFIPWTILHLLAASELAGTLSSYYGFPYLIAAFFPVIGWQMRPTGPPRQFFLGFSAMILASFTSLSAQHDPSHAPLIASFTAPPGFVEQARIERVMTAIERDRPALGRVLAGDSVASLRPREFRRNETFWDGPAALRDTLFYFEGDRDSSKMTALAAASGLNQVYAVTGTPVRIVTNRKAMNLPALGPLLVPLSR